MEPKVLSPKSNFDAKLDQMNTNRRQSLGSQRRRSSVLQRSMTSRGFVTEDQYSSAVEKFIATVFAPELTSYQGRMSVLTIWLMLVICALNGVQHVSINFKFEYFIPPGTTPDKYFTLDRIYFNSGTSATVYTENDDPMIDFSLPEV